LIGFLNTDSEIKGLNSGADWNHQKMADKKS